MLVMYLLWYDRNEDFTPNYSKDHTGTIRGNNADDVMSQLRTLRNNHDLAKYTRIEITGISD